VQDNETGDEDAEETRAEDMTDEVQETLELEGEEAQVVKKNGQGMQELEGISETTVDGGKDAEENISEGADEKNINHEENLDKVKDDKKNKKVRCRRMLDFEHEEVDEHSRTKTKRMCESEVDDEKKAKVDEHTELLQLRALVAHYKKTLRGLLASVFFMSCLHTYVRAWLYNATIARGPLGHAPHGLVSNSN